QLETSLLDDLSSGFRPLPSCFRLVLSDHSLADALLPISRRGIRPVVLKSAQIDGVKTQS
ncbi:hypothetical protein PENTCL1PPCAC_27640, partial [Pristionchus entomophagus]